jgi:hypothetical protein
MALEFTPRRVLLPLPQENTLKREFQTKKKAHPCRVGF